jgi:hypothetical protein
MISTQKALEEVTKVLEKKYLEGVPETASIEKELENTVRQLAEKVLFAIGLASDIGKSSAFANALYFWNEQFPNYKIGLDEAIDNYFRGKLSKEELYNLGKSYGYNSTQVDLLINVRQRLIDLDALIDLKFRKEIKDEDFYNRAKALGFTKEDVDLIAKLKQWIPGPSDLITFAVREAFNEQAVAKNQQDLNLEETWNNISKYAESIGLTKDIFKYFWRSHWELPSPTFAFEMYRRGLITKEELRQLLIWLDYMPAYIDKIIELSSEVIPRVDIRRMYEAKLVDREKVYKTYRALGYSPEDAELMTKFVELNYSEVDKDLTKSEILEGFRDGILDTNRAIDMLVKLGYDEIEANYLISLEQAKMERQRVTKKVEYAKTNYIQGYWNKEQVIDYLNKLPLPSSTIKDILVTIDEEKIKNLKLPSKEEILRWYKKGLVDEEIATNLLVLTGYPQIIAKMYLLEIEYDNLTGS